MEAPSSRQIEQPPSSPALFVGREVELRALEAMLESATAGRGQVVLISGEPGIGKTRTSDVFAAGAEASGALVLWGRCHEWEGAPPYWPWIQVLRAYLSTVDDDRLRTQLGAGAVDIAQVLPELRQRVPNLPELPAMEPEQARFRLFDALTTFLLNAARSRPLVIVLDDLHWGDSPSLLLLQFLAQSIRQAPILLLGTYRDVEVQRQHALSITLAELAREQHTTRIALRGLSPEDVGTFVAEMSQGVASDALVAAVHAETEGNPFFVGEMVRLLSAEGRLTEHAQPPLRRVPESVRGVIRRRLDRLPAECNRVLAIAAVAGRTFSARLLADVTHRPVDELLDLLDVTVQAGLVEQDAGVGQYRFSHALVQETLYEDVSAAQRMRLHAQIGRALEETYAADLAPHYADLSHHFVQAAPAGMAETALGYAVKAAERATAQLAWETAVTHYELALQALDLQARPDAAIRCDVLLALGEAQNRVAAGRPRTGNSIAIGAGGSPGGRSTFWHAAEVAQRAMLPEHLARAALGVVGFNPNAHQGGPEGLKLLETALNMLPKADSQLRVRLLARSGVDSYMLAFHGKLPPTAELEEQIRASNDTAIAMARRLDDPRSLAYTLIMVSLQSTLYSADERLRITEEIVELARTAGDLQTLSWGLVQQEYALEELGQIARANTVLERRLPVAEQLRIPYFQWYAAIGTIGKALRTGHFAEAERWIEIANAIQPHSGAVTTQLITLRREQGRVEELMEMINRQLTNIPDASHTRSLRIICQLESGEAKAAHEAFELMAADGFANRFIALRALTWLAVACAAFEDTDRAELLYCRLASYAGQNVVSGGTDLSGGSVEYYLGLLAATMSRWDEAERHFAAALAMNERWGIRPYVAHTKYAWAGMLMRCGKPEDQERAREMADEARILAEEIGMTRLIDKARRLGGRPHSIRAAHGLSPRELDVLRLIAAGHADKEIAVTLSISPRTVTTHVTHIFNKLGANTRTEAAMIAVQAGIL